MYLLNRNFYDTYTFVYFQDYLEGRVAHVSVAMDNHAGIPYGTHVCIPELNRKYHRFIDFVVRMQLIFITFES